MSQTSAPMKEPGARRASSPDWVSIISWGVAAMVVVLAGLILLGKIPLNFGGASPAQAEAEVPAVPEASGGEAVLPEFAVNDPVEGLVRYSDPRTIIPKDERRDVTSYTVGQGDSIFGIARDYNLKPESVLWANYDQLQDDPQMVEVGLTLNIPPTDGVYYKWREGDTLEKVAEKYKATVMDILTWPGNYLDVTNPKIDAGTYVMIPNGRGEFKQWTIPVTFRPQSGANQTIGGQCSNFQNGPGGTGVFIWPTTGQHVISGNDFWDGHLGIDIAAFTGDAVLAADSGWITYAGPISGGYGNVVVMDHGNGFSTVYAHNSQVLVSCGQYVNQGKVIALAGSTGNSTGPHLHFELRYYSAFENPWSYLQ